MRKMKILVPLVMLALFVCVGFGCSNPDNLNLPEVPNTGGDGPGGDPIDPTTPTPYTQVDLDVILDFAFEKDGDLAISEMNTGIQLFDTFGEYRRRISTQPPGITPYDGMVDIVPGWQDSGRGIIATGPPVECGWVSFYDDEYVTGGTLFGSPAGWWWAGEAHPPSPECNLFPSSGIFGCPEWRPPRGIDLHPIYGWLFVRVGNPKITLDGGDCDLEYDEIPPNRNLSGAIIAMHPRAPLEGATLDFYEGTSDWIAYHNRSDHELVLFYQYAMASASIQTFCWDETG